MLPTPVLYSRLSLQISFQCLVLTRQEQILSADDTLCYSCLCSLVDGDQDSARGSTSPPSTQAMSHEHSCFNHTPSVVRGDTRSTGKWEDISDISTSRLPELPSSFPISCGVVYRRFISSTLGLGLTCRIESRKCPLARARTPRHARCRARQSSHARLATYQRRSECRCAPPCPSANVR